MSATVHGGPYCRLSCASATYVPGALVQSVYGIWLVDQSLSVPKGPGYLSLLDYPWSSYPPQGLPSFLHLLHKSPQDPPHVSISLSTCLLVRCREEPFHGQLSKAPVWEHNRVSIIMSSIGACTWGGSQVGQVFIAHSLSFCSRCAPAFIFWQGKYCSVYLLCYGWNWSFRFFSGSQIVTIWILFLNHIRCFRSICQLMLSYFASLLVYFFLILILYFCFSRQTFSVKFFLSW